MVWMHYNTMHAICKVIGRSKTTKCAALQRIITPILWRKYEGVLSFIVIRFGQLCRPEERYLSRFLAAFTTVRRSRIAKAGNRSK
jgi:hypothetical protein